MSKQLRLNVPLLVTVMTLLAGSQMPVHAAPQAGAANAIAGGCDLQTLSKSKAEFLRLFAMRGTDPSAVTDEGSATGFSQPRHQGRIVLPGALRWQCNDALHRRWWRMFQPQWQSTVLTCLCRVTTMSTGKSTWHVPPGDPRPVHPGSDGQFYGGCFLHKGLRHRHPGPQRP